MKKPRNGPEPRLSCIVLSCDSHLNKGNSVLHSLASIFNQDYDDFEIVVIENSHIKSQQIKRINEFCKERNDTRSIPIHVELINGKRSLGRGSARNKCVELARGNVLIFLDDDTIIVDKEAFTKISKLSYEYDYGYGAKRLWTEEGWFRPMAKSVLDDILMGDMRNLLAHSDSPKDGVRGPGDITLALQKVTFIANFGFCKKKAFQQIGGFPDYDDYGFEDDYLMFRLYEAGYKNSILDNLRVVHVNHQIKPMTKRNLIPYFQDLVKSGYYWFHVSALFNKKPSKREDVLEVLKPIRYEDMLEEAYNTYKNLAPLNIPNRNNRNYQSWASNNRYSKLAYAQLVATLQKSSTIDHFVNISGGDFDNLARVIQAAVDHGFIAIDKNTGKIIDTHRFKFTQLSRLDKVCGKHVPPKNKFNQFPCDKKSLVRRIKLLKERYPFVEYVRIAIIGDDDLLSIQLKNNYWIWPVVIEADRDVVKKISDNNTHALIYEMDLRDFNQLPRSGVATFITDPPYTLDGALAFIYAGLFMLSKDTEEKEFYVIMNKTMMGKSLLKLQKILSRSGICLVETVNNFNQYELPKHYAECLRARRFLKKRGIISSALTMSSSSNLYIFKTTNPNLGLIKRSINPQKIYEHY